MWKPGRPGRRQKAPARHRGNKNEYIFFPAKMGAPLSLLPLLLNISVVIVLYKAKQI